jgi:hypothetical protein
MASTERPRWQESHRQREIQPGAAPDDQQAVGGKFVMSEPGLATPPVIPVKGGATLGRIGMAVSFITPLVFLLMLLIKPG